MSDTAGARNVVDPVAKAGYELEFEDTFDGDTLDPSRWLYAAEWTPEYVAFFVDQELVKLVEQSPTSPMQFLLNIYAFPDEGQTPHPARPYPKEFTVDYVRGCRGTA